MSQIREGDWFVTVDLKDAYFHIQVVQRHRKFLRLAFGGKAYQYKVLPFGLTLAPRTFTKCMDAALAPLRFQGIRVLNYLDDWLILANSRELVSCHRDIVLRHIRALGLRTNTKKIVLSPSRQTVFLGVHLDSVQMQARFKLGYHVSVSTCHRFQGIMAAATPVLTLGLLHMRPFLWWMRLLRVRSTGPATHLIRVSRSCFHTHFIWRDPTFLWSGVRIGAIHRRHMVMTDASMTGWGAVFEGRPARGVWTGEFLSWHINCLELRAVSLALIHFYPFLKRCHVIVRTDNGQWCPHKSPGGSRSCTLNRLACHILIWSQDKFQSSSGSGSFEPSSRLSVETEAQTGGVDVELSDSSPDLAEVDLFTSQGLSQCPFWFFLRSLAPLGTDAFAHPWPNVGLYAFPPVKLIPAVLCRVKESVVRLLLVAPFWPSQTWFSELIPLPYWPPWDILIRQDLLSHLQGKIWHPQPEIWKLCVWPIEGHGFDI